MPGTGKSPTDEDDCTPTKTELGKKHSRKVHHMRTRAATSGRMNATAAKQQIPSSYQLGESRLVYEYGKVVGEDQEYIKQSIDAFNAHPDIQLKCEHLEEAGLRYLRFTSLH
jgi:hypothetical protein